MLKKEKYRFSKEFIVQTYCRIFIDPFSPAEGSRRKQGMLGFLRLFLASV